jgi:hypothetical protein
VLDRAFDLDALRPQLGGQPFEAAAGDRQGEVHVPAAAVRVLLGPRRPDAEPGAPPGREPDAIALACEHRETEPTVEALEAADVGGLEDQLADAAHRL